MWDGQAGSIPAPRPRCENEPVAKIKGRVISNEFEAVDPRRFGTFIPGAFIQWDKFNGSELTLPPNTILTASSNLALTVGEVDGLLARTQEVRLLFSPWSGWRSDVYDIGGDNVAKAWQRLRPMYMLDDGYPPEGYAGTSLVALQWVGDAAATLVFGVEC